jgi:hypothetical protein
MFFCPGVEITRSKKFGGDAAMASQAAHRAQAAEQVHFLCCYMGFSIVKYPTPPHSRRFSRYFWNMKMKKKQRKSGRKTCKIKRKRRKMKTILYFV